MRVLFIVLAILFLSAGTVFGQTENAKNPFKNWTFESEHGDYFDEVRTAINQIKLRTVMGEVRAIPKQRHFEFFPIKYWIQPVDEKWMTIIRSAFEDYNYFIPMQEVSDEWNADITLKITDVEELKSMGNDQALAVGGLHIVDGKLKGRVMLLSDTFDDNYYSTRRTIKHEIGHALGICCHSNSPNDLMYQKTYYKFLPDGKTVEIGEIRLKRPVRLMDAFTARDLNTLWLLYNEW